MPAQPGEQTLKYAACQEALSARPLERAPPLVPTRARADRSGGRGAVAAYSCQQLAAWALAVLDARLDGGPLPAAWAELGRRAAAREAQLLPPAILRQVHQARSPQAARDPACTVRGAGQAAFSRPAQGASSAALLGGRAASWGRRVELRRCRLRLQLLCRAGSPASPARPGHWTQQRASPPAHRTRAQEAAGPAPRLAAAVLAAQASPAPRAGPAAHGDRR